MLMDKSKVKKIYTGRFNNGDDLLKEIENFINEKKIKKGFVSVIGAVEKAVIGYYNQETKKYIKQKYNKPMEIVSLTGNISINENKNFPHLHIVLADKTLKTVGGHLFEGTKIFAAEFFIMELTGKKLVRKFDKITKLKLFFPEKT